jgi:hypothetical protein
MKTLIFLVAVSASFNLFAHTFNVNTVGEFRAALTNSQANGEADVINVAAGTYNISTPLTHAGMEAHSLAIVGAGAATTRLNGGNAVQIMNLENSSGGSLSVSGLTFYNGSNSVGIGGGLFILCTESAVPTVGSCVFSNNFARQAAGGVYVSPGNAGAVVTNCIAVNNTTGIDDGGGIYVYKDTGAGTILVNDNIMYNNHLHANPGAVGGIEGSALFIYYLGSYCTMIISNNVMYGNTQESGGGVFYLRATAGGTIIVCDNIFSNNVVSDNTEIQGGAVNLQLETGSMRVNGNIFQDNSVTGEGEQGDGGGAALTFNTAGSFECIGNVFAGNQANRHGGGALINLGNSITSAYIVQNLYVGNQAGSSAVGGGLQLNAECDVRLVNNTYYRNTASDAGGFGFYAEAAADSAALFNEVYCSNAPNSLAVVGAGPVAAQYSNIEGGSGETWFGTGCIAADPAFLNRTLPAGPDGMYATSDDGLQLTASSPSVDTGLNSAVPAGITTDLIGGTRIYDGRVDMGCYEFIPEPVCARIMLLMLAMLSKMNYH